MNTQNQMPPSVFSHRLLFSLEESLKGVDARDQTEQSSCFIYGGFWMATYGIS